MRIQKVGEAEDLESHKKTAKGKNRGGRTAGKGDGVVVGMTPCGKGKGGGQRSSIKPGESRGTGRNAGEEEIDVEEKIVRLEWGVTQIKTKCHLEEKKKQRKVERERM